MLTPFEKNLEVWRQLWRVLERSDVIVQVCCHVWHVTTFVCDATVQSFLQWIFTCSTNLLPNHLELGVALRIPGFANCL